jgi:CheY-like chemotaxis protein
MTTVMIIDDAADIRLLLRMVLSLEGFSVTEAESGRHALEQLAAGERPDIAVLDVQMPELDGWETLARIRQDPATADLRVVMCTVKSQPTDLLQAWGLGCDGYLSKPIEVRSLAVTLRQVLARGDDERRAVREERIAAVQAAAVA